MSKLISTQTIHVNAGDLARGFIVKTGYSYKIVVQQREALVEVIEAEDVLFRTDSALFLPFAIPAEEQQDDDYPFESDDDPQDEQVKVSGLNVIAGLFRYYQLCMDHGDAKYLLITGHTDTSGEESYNEKLSQMRADVVRCIILGNKKCRSQFVLTVKEKHAIEDIQHVLVWLSKMLGVPQAHPGEIDGRLGPNTRRAIRDVKKYFKSAAFPPKKYQGISFSEDFDRIKKTLSNDADFGANLWAIIFEIYQAELEVSLKQDGININHVRDNLKWVDPDKIAVGCGETWPIDSRGKDNYKSQSNRRVEILFYDPNEIKAALPCKEDKCAEEDCHIFKNIGRYNPGALETRMEWAYVGLSPWGAVEYEREFIFSF